MASRNVPSVLIVTRISPDLKEMQNVKRNALITQKNESECYIFCKVKILDFLLIELSGYSNILQGA